jgi:hypothetical protein
MGRRKGGREGGKEGGDRVDRELERLMSVPAGEEEENASERACPPVPPLLPFLPAPLLPHSLRLPCGREARQFSSGSSV